MLAPPRHADENGGYPLWNIALSELYVSVDRAAPIAALLNYTAAGDSGGTLEGLVRLGRPERLGSIMRRALERASWCSADPVCSEELGGQGSRLANVAATHASCFQKPHARLSTRDWTGPCWLALRTRESTDSRHLSSRRRTCSRSRCSDRVSRFDRRQNPSVTASARIVGSGIATWHPPLHRARIARGRQAWGTPCRGAGRNQVVIDQRRCGGTRH